MSNICDTLPLTYEYGQDNKYTILVLGATHGDEPAGHHIIKNMMNRASVTNAKVIFVPSVNNCGYILNRRYNYLFTDINRNYYDDTDYKINKYIIDLVNKSDFVIDIHEAYDYHRINKESIGSTITLSYNDKHKKSELENIILSNVNKYIVDEDKKFVSLNAKDQMIDGTLLQYCINKNKNYMLIEITGKLDKQPLDKRIEQGTNILNSVFSYFDIM
jgi:predicted deacylase